jgi:hypothetical protein
MFPVKASFMNAGWQAPAAFVRRQSIGCYSIDPGNQILARHHRAGF